MRSDGRLYIKIYKKENFLPVPKQNECYNFSSKLCLEDMLSYISNTISCCIYVRHRIRLTFYKYTTSHSNMTSLTL